MYGAESLKCPTEGWRDVLEAVALFRPIPSTFSRLGRLV